MARELAVAVGWAASIRTHAKPVQGDCHMNQRTFLATAAAIFAAGAFAAAAHAETIHCGGTNACKGQSACKSASNACKGQNACKGKGFTEASDAASVKP